MRVTFLNGDEKLRQRGLKMLKNVKDDLDLLFFPENHTIKEILDFLDDDILERIYFSDIDELEDQIREELENRLNNYPLGVDYVPGNTNYNPDPYGYIRYQICWGGPSCEVRFHDNELIEFVFLDWFVGVGFDVTEDPVFRELKSYVEGLSISREEC